MRERSILFVAWLAAAAHPARADEAATDIDVHAAELVDVVETSDGSVWKGVIVEQTPNEQYKLAMADGSVRAIKAADVVKITKQKNRDWRAPIAAVATPPTAPLGLATTFTCTAVGDAGIGASYSPQRLGPPPPMSREGTQLEAAGVLIFPAGYIKVFSTSYAPDVRGGYEWRFGPVGVTAGGLARFSYWSLPMGSDPNDAAWTLETHGFGRATYHLERVAAFAGVSAGMDTNFLHTGLTNMSQTTTGFGMNVEAGVEVELTPNIAARLGAAYHPATDKISNLGGSIEYAAIFATMVGRL